MWPSGLGEKWVASDAMCAATYDAPAIRRCTVPEDRVRFSDSRGPRPLDIVVRLAAPTLTHFRAVLEPEHRIVVARSWASLPKVVRCRHVDLVVVDVARCSDEPFAAGSPGGANGQFRRR